ncbi:hypothetical protein B0H11DRAFT_1919328 [Mycena galericulata]|nr:hypothetical protein B0H11DRAFT_1919328 [Mycena galericulata]
MPWHESSDNYPDGSICHFVLGLNEQLASLVDGGIIYKYAFTERTALMLLASSVQGRDGVYHPFTPTSLEFASKVEYPLERPTPTCPRPRMGKIDVRCVLYPLRKRHLIVLQGYIITCHLEPMKWDGKGCGDFEAGLACIRSSLRQACAYGYWFHTRAADAYGRVFPSTSTYVFQRPYGLKHIFRVCWHTASYPPPPKTTQLTYPISHYFNWEIKVPLNIEPLAAQHLSPEALKFLEGVLKGNSDKGKTRA